MEWKVMMIYHCRDPATHARDWTEARRREDSVARLCNDRFNDFRGVRRCKDIATRMHDDRLNDLRDYYRHEDSVG